MGTCKINGWCDDLECVKGCKAEHGVSASFSDDLLCCPHCGSKDGYYRRFTASGKGQFNYAFSDKPNDLGGDNTHLHDNIIYHEQKTMRCQKCDEKIGLFNAT